MPVRNALPYLDAAIESILAQSCEDFEFVILDDGSDDGSVESLRGWAQRDRRIRLVEGAEGKGPVGSSNFVVSIARAPIVARMDADDIATPDRLQCQLELLARYPDAVLVGSVWEGIDRQGRIVREPDLSALEGGRFAAPFAHGSITFRRWAFEAAGGYRAGCEFWEDLDLFVRMSGKGRVLVVPRPLYRYRFSETSTRLNSRRRAVEEAVDLMFRCRAAFERSGDYAPVLEAPRISDPARKLHPYTFLSLGFIPLWSGLRPPTLKNLMARGALGPNAVTAKALIWAIWASLSPLSLRATMRLALRYRNRRAARKHSILEIREWSPTPLHGARPRRAGNEDRLPIPSSGLAPRASGA
jgi:hypothetical protein